MTTYTTEKIETVKARTILRINGAPFSFVTVEDIIAIEGDQVELSEKAAAQVEARTAKDKKNAARNARKNSARKNNAARERIIRMQQENTIDETIRASAGMAGWTQVQATPAQINLLIKLAHEGKVSERDIPAVLTQKDASVIISEAL